MQTTVSEPARKRVAVRGWAALGVLAGYAIVSFLCFGVALFVEPGARYIGSENADPDIFIWSFAWWPHAILHGENPFVTHAVWAPAGANLTWVTSVPALALLFAPLTYLVGPIVSYDVAAIALPALAAWTAYLLCRYVTGKLWPSVVGGYLFGFSSYVIAHAAVGHLNLTAVFLLPLAPLLALCFLDGRIAGGTFLAAFTLLLVFQLLLSTEIFATFSLAVAVAVALGFVFLPARRARLGSLALHLAGAYAAAAVLAGPFLYYLAIGYRTGGGFIGAVTELFSADLLNFSVPTTFSLVGSGPADAVGKLFSALPYGQDAYLGIPTLLIVGLFAWHWRRRPSALFLCACFVVAVVAALGTHARIWGISVVPLPWEVAHALPLLKGVETARIAVFASLVAAVVVAMWAATPRRDGLNVLLPALAVVALLPDPTLGRWTRGYAVPAFFTDSAYRGCLDPGENILPLPIAQGDAMLWQAVSGFRFTIAGGYLGRLLPGSFEADERIRYIATGNHLGAAQADDVRAFVAAEHVTSAVVEGSEADFFRGALDKVATPHETGGVVLYHFTPAAAPSC
jgi:hypothetical protein